MVDMGVMLEPAMQLALKWHVGTFIPGQHTKSLAQAFMPTTPWFAKCKWCYTFPLRDVSTPLSAEAVLYFPEIIALWFCLGISFRESVKLSLLGLHNFDLLCWMCEWDQVMWQSHYCHNPLLLEWLLILL